MDSPESFKELVLNTDWLMESKGLVHTIGRCAINVCIKDQNHYNLNGFYIHD